MAFVNAITYENGLQKRQKAVKENNDTKAESDRKIVQKPKGKKIFPKAVGEDNNSGKNNNDKENTKGTQKENTKANPKDNPKDTPKENQKDNQKDNQKNNPKENPKQGNKDDNQKTQNENTGNKDPNQAKKPNGTPLPLFPDGSPNSNVPANNNTALPSSNSGSNNTSAGGGEIFGFVVGALIAVGLIGMFVRKKVVGGRTKSREIDDTERKGSEGADGSYVQKPHHTPSDNFDDQEKQRFDTLKLMIDQNPPLSPQLSKLPHVDSNLNSRRPYDSSTPPVTPNSYDSQLGPPSVNNSSYPLQKKNSMESLRPLINSPIPSSPRNPQANSPNSQSFPFNSQQNEPPYPQITYQGPLQGNQYYGGPPPLQQLYPIEPTHVQGVLSQSSNSPRPLEDPPHSSSSSKGEPVPTDNQDLSYSMPSSQQDQSNTQQEPSFMLTNQSDNTNVMSKFTNVEDNRLSNVDPDEKRTNDLTPKLHENTVVPGLLSTPVSDNSLTSESRDIQPNVTPVSFPTSNRPDSQTSSIESNENKSNINQNVQIESVQPIQRMIQIENLDEHEITKNNTPLTNNELENKQKVPEISVQETRQIEPKQGFPMESDNSENQVVKTPIHSSPQLKQPAVTGFIKSVKANMVIGRVSNESRPIMKASPVITSLQAQPRMQPETIETVSSYPEISAPIITETFKPEMIIPKPVVAPVSHNQRSVPPRFDIDAIKRHVEKVKHMKAAIADKNSVINESHNAVNNERVLDKNQNQNIENTTVDSPSQQINNDKPKSEITSNNENQGKPLVRKKSVRFQADLTNQEEVHKAPNKVERKSILINKDDVINIQDSIKQDDNDKSLSSEDEDYEEDDEESGATFSVYQMYDYQDSSAPELPTNIESDDDDEFSMR
ncbi:17257_t:CDS:2 [Funneliformis geosporum]|uniref:17257_t:CDS:1 n=1 Tax=Funneliformis geosporum TaxID=1117311 RepID=A0A9W4SGY1_9GLOM|nr:17257_t:CDS:2 [Funneliformis geosporum]